MALVCELAHARRSTAVMSWQMKSSNISSSAQGRRAVCQSTLRLTTTRRSRCSVRRACRSWHSKVSTASLRTRCCTASFLHAVLCVQRRDAGPPSSRGARLDVGVKRRDRRRDRGLALARGRRRHSPAWCAHDVLRSDRARTRPVGHDGRRAQAGGADTVSQARGGSTGARATAVKRVRNFLIVSLRLAVVCQITPTCPARSSTGRDLRVAYGARHRHRPQRLLLAYSTTATLCVSSRAYSSCRAALTTFIARKGGS